MQSLPRSTAMVVHSIVRGSSMLDLFDHPCLCIAAWPAPAILQCSIWSKSAAYQNKIMTYVKFSNAHFMCSIPPSILVLVRIMLSAALTTAISNCLKYTRI